MKKLIFLVFTILTISSYSQTSKNNYNVFKLGGVVIKIPTPGKQFVEAGAKQREYFGSFEPNTINIQCVFMDTSEYRKIVKEKNDTLAPERYFLVESIKKHEATNCTLDEFADIRKGVIETLAKNSNQITDTIEYIINQPSDLIRDVKLEKPNSIGCIYDTKNACGILQLSVFKSNYKTRKMMRTLNYILIKNRVVILYVNYLYYGKESINRIIKVSRSWAKAILESNK